MDITDEEWNRLTREERIWAYYAFSNPDCTFYYLTEPSPAIEMLLERLWGPLDFNITYV